MNVQEKPRVLVMLTSYNGEAFIEEQIDSILAQRDVAITLWISDDGSTDDTLKICERIAAEHDNVRISQNETNLGCAKNFMHMLEEAKRADYDYFAFSDQDDYWLPEKLSVAVNALKNVEGPALYYSNIENTDINLENGWLCRDPDYEHYLDKGFALIRCSAGGCTQVFNKELAALVACDLPEYLRLHDAWVQLVAQFCGTVIPDMKHSYIKRRISGNNVEGISREDRKGLWRSRLSTFGADKNCYSKTAAQLAATYADNLTIEDKAMVERLSGYKSSFPTWIALMFDRRFHMNNLKATVFFKLKVLCRVV